MNRQSNKIIEKHSTLLRICHWLNIPLLGLMVWSGILIYWADQAFIKIPDEFIEVLGINHRLAEGMGWHFLIMWPFFINGLIYFIYLILSGEWRDRIPDRQSFSEFHQVILYDFKLRKKPVMKRGKYNAVQRFLYPAIILMGFGSVITGLAIYKPVQLGILVTLLGGYTSARLLHFYLMIGFLVFTVIHVLQVMRSGWNSLRSMIAGFEIEK